MMRLFVSARSIFIGLLLLCPLSAEAQTFGRVEETNTNAPGYFFHARTGEATVRLAVWGDVGAPGTYEVTSGSTLGGVLSLAGGVRQPVQTDNVESTVTVHVDRLSGMSMSLSYDELLSEREQIVLQEGDFVQVTTISKRKFGFRDALSITGSVAAVAVAVVQVVILFR